MGAFRLKRLDYFEQVANRPSQTIEPDDDEDFALRDLSDEPRQNRPSPGGAGSVFLMDDRAAGSLELVELSRLLPAPPSRRGRNRSGVAE